MYYNKNMHKKRKIKRINDDGDDEENDDDGEENDGDGEENDDVEANFVDFVLFQLELDQ